MTKQIKEVVLDQYARDTLDGLTLEEALHKIKQWIQQYGGKSKLDIGQGCEDYSYSDKEYAYVHIVGKREETDEEYAKRQDDEQAQQNIRIQREQAEFERLAKIYGEKK
jgi:hypothetical protein